jgi:hypothetical protein
LTSDIPEDVHIDNVGKISMKTVDLLVPVQIQELQETHPLASALNEFPSTRILPSVIEEII